MTMAVLSGCSGASDEPSAPTVTVPVRISVPVSSSSAGRAVGDPGVTESWDARPTYAYVALASYRSASDAAAKADGIVDTAIFHLSSDKWERDEALSSDEGDVYTYSDNLTMTLRDGYTTVYTYAAVANHNLNLPGALSASRPATETALQGLTFDIPAEMRNDVDQTDDFLRHLYSTPYKRRVEDPTYAKVDFTDEKRPTVHVMCYHVAARLDLTWTVAESLQESVHLTHIEVKNATPTTGCLLFDPTNAGNDGLGDYQDRVYIGSTDPTDTASELTMWYGRKYHYVVHTASRSSFSLLLGREWADPTHTTVVPVTSGDFDSVYTPWIRMNISVSKAF